MCEIRLASVNSLVLLYRWTLKKTPNTSVLLFYNIKQSNSYKIKGLEAFNHPYALTVTKS